MCLDVVDLTPWIPALAYAALNTAIWDAGFGAIRPLERPS